MASTYEVKPPKMTLTNLVSQVTLEAQYNPETFEEEIGANYSKLAVQGLSHQVKQFGYTEDNAFQISLDFEALSRGPKGMENLAFARRFLLSAHYPRGNAGAIRTAGAPRILFVWPGLISLTCVLLKTKFSYSQFNRLAGLVRMRATINIEEIRDVLITSEEVFLQGSMRSTAQKGGL